MGSYKFVPLVSVFVLDYCIGILVTTYTLGTVDNTTALIDT